MKAIINNTSLNEIKEFAEFITLDYNSPTPLEEIANSEGIKIIADDYGIDSFDGITTFENDRFYIHLNTSRGNQISSNRGRFTLAHELGHYFIDSHRIGLESGVLTPHPTFLNQNSNARIEKEADYFASCLLMPESVFLKEIHRKRFSFQIIQHISTIFKVSITAAAIRFSQIGNHPIMVIYASNNLIIWKTSSDDFPYKKILLDDNKIPKDTVLGEYFNLKNTDDTNREEQVYAVDWFRYVSEWEMDRIFYEYCLPHKNTAMSIIWGE